MGIFTGFEKIVRPDEPMAMHTWFQLGGPAEYFAEPGDLDELVALVRRGTEEGLPMRVLGRGSNILVRDEGVSGLVIFLSAPVFRNISIDGHMLSAGGGARLGRVVTTAVHAGLAGIEELVAIPGTFGGAVHGNAGTHGGDIGQWVASATVLTHAGEIVQREREDMVFGYRKSSLDELVIVSATLELEEEDPRELAKRLQKHWIIRKANQPLGHQSAGCIFKNPVGVGAGAGELIDDAGLKGTRVGGAVVSDHHANFIVAEQNCTSQDVLALIEQVRTQVAERMEVELEQEIEIW
ncbi:MAG: UDP-N-acetylmuramate dehydrogenase [Pirellulales bacterium]|nr:UDP-N-acetylmuramate dehydrogenase [Pirellulales bacterium]